MSYLFAAPPWSVVRTGDRVNVTSGIYNVCDVYEVPAQDGYTELSQESNAALIAAAPEMYALLERLTLVKDLEKLEEYKERVRKLFLMMGVTFTQYHLREIAREEEVKNLTKAKAEIDNEMTLMEEKDILQKYFGDNWLDYELYRHTIGYHAVSKAEEFKEYYIFENDGVHPTPYFLSQYYWDGGNNGPAYVIPSFPSQKMADAEYADSYYYGDIKDKLMEAGVDTPDMDIVLSLIKGQSVEQLIEEYKRYEKELEEIDEDSYETGKS